MQRKIITQGNNSYTVTLPHAWVKEHGLTGSDSVTMNEIEGTLVLSPEKSTPKPRAITVDLKTRTMRDIINTLHQAYRKGFDKITLHHSTKNELAEINRTVKNTMLGFEVTLEEAGTCSIENIAEPAPDKFETIFKKLFYLLKTEATEIVSDLKKTTYDTTRREEQKNQIHLYTNYLRRTLICSRIETKANSHLLYQLISLLSVIQYRYHSLHSAIAQQRTPLTKNAIAQLEMTLEPISLLLLTITKKDPAYAFRIQELKDRFEKTFLRSASQMRGTDVFATAHALEIVILVYNAGNAALGYLFSAQE